MQICDKVKQILSEAAKPADKKKIDAFVQFLKKKNTKKFSQKNADKLLKGSDIDIDFLVTFWTDIKSRLEKEKIVVEHEQYLSKKENQEDET